MKNLLIMRHAKSDWDDKSLSDFDRPLSNRGQKAAPFMGKELTKKNKVPELIISSPANRAKTTAQLVAESTGYQSTIQFEKDFYFGYIDEIVAIIRKSDNNKNRIMIVGHNPTWESLVSLLTKKEIYSGMPTAAIASLIFEINDWSHLEKETAKLEWILIPKVLMQGES